MKEQDKVDFGVWVPVKMIVIPAILSVIFLGLGFVHWGFLVPAGFFILIATYFAVARRTFSKDDAGFQNQVQELLLDQINWGGKGRALDIGCGNGPLTIKLAQHFPKAEIVGVDYWGKKWDYSVHVCEENARLSGVDGRITFRSGSASALPFKDDSFDLVVSNLVFHEVHGVADKRTCIKEALRVLKPGGIFVFQDLFLLQAYFGTPEELIDTVRSWGISEVAFMPTHDQPFIPHIVKLPFMVGALAILHGAK